MAILRAVELDLGLQDRKAERERLLGDYLYFFQCAWPWVEDAPLVMCWHIELMCRYLQALQRRDPFRDLVMNVPPGCTKSMNASVIWPAYVYAHNPAERILAASFDGAMVTKNANDCKRLINSEWYQAFFGDRVKIRPGADTQAYWETTEGGWRLSTTPRGIATGRHPTCIIADDLHSVRKAESDTDRKATVDWWDTTLSTRGAGAMMNRCRVLIGQRIHERDVPGHVLATDEDRTWARLILPMRYEPNRMPDIGLGRDPRTKVGELLAPKMFPEAEVKRLERRLGIYGTAGQFQQRPTKKGGEKIKTDMIKIISAAEVPFTKIVRFKRAWDRAGTAGAGDFTSGPLGGMTGGEVPKLFVLDMAHSQWETDEVLAQMRLWARIDQKRFGQSKYEVVFERGASDAGIQAAKETRRRLRGHRVRSVLPKGSKEVRAESFANAVAAGEVYFVDGPWVGDCLDELAHFPLGEHDDRVDALALLYNELIKGSMFEAEIEPEEPELVKCANPSCDRMAADDADYCCDSCLHGQHENRKLKAADHCPECNYRHNQLAAKDLWSPRGLYVEG